MATLLIGYDLNRAGDYSELIEAIKSIGSGVEIEDLFRGTGVLLQRIEQVPEELAEQSLARVLAQAPEILRLPRAEPVALCCDMPLGGEGP